MKPLRQILPQLVFVMTSPPSTNTFEYPKRAGTAKQPALFYFFTTYSIHQQWFAPLKYVSATLITAPTR